MTLKEQINNETEAITFLAESLNEKQLLASILFELKKLRYSVKLVENEISVIKLKLK